MGVISSVEWDGLMTLLRKRDWVNVSKGVGGKEEVSQEKTITKEKKTENTNFFPPHMQRSDYIKKAREQGDAKGLFAAGLVISLWWIGMYIAMFNWKMEDHSILANVVLGLFIAYMYTGMFITAHDSMHGVICPSYRKINNFIGWFCVQCYAVFDYKRLLDSHWEHHQFSGQPLLDPDFHDGKHKTFFGWYWVFMVRNMQPVRQLGGMTVIFYTLHLVFSVPVSNLILLWAVPALLSSLQLFYFGTYIVHTDNEESTPYPDKHNARTVTLPMWLHLLLCYNFMLHHEHHLLPFVPWWRLPYVHLKLKEVQGQE
eukprot:c17984_g1_i3.p1 GENE.c17984_g1_i3~~c17984_g1_i3.p1  ORF type:complete len:334 (+),score=17.61 c17984_g1_i3:65-1003(+)